MLLRVNEVDLTLPIQCMIYLGKSQTIRLFVSVLNLDTLLPAYI